MLTKYIQASFSPRNYPPEDCIAMVTVSIINSCSKRIRLQGRVGKTDHKSCWSLKLRSTPHWIVYLFRLVFGMSLMWWLLWKNASQPVREIFFSIVGSYAEMKLWCTSLGRVQYTECTIINNVCDMLFGIWIRPPMELLPYLSFVFLCSLPNTLWALSHPIMHNVFGCAPNWEGSIIVVALPSYRLWVCVGDFYNGIK